MLGCNGCHKNSPRDFFTLVRGRDSAEWGFREQPRSYHTACAVCVRDARIRDRRRRSWFSADNEILDDYGPKFGIYGFGVYCALCRYAYSNTEEATVSIRTMTKKLRMGHTKLLETLSALEDAGLISIERGDREHSNVYTLLEVPKGVPGEEQGGVPGREQYKRSVSQNSSKGVNTT